MTVKKDLLDYVPVDEARWVTGGPPFFDLLEDLIVRATRSVSLYVYILTPDTTGNRIIRLLLEAQRRGVKVRLMVDDFGSDELGETIEQELKSAGVLIHRFEPLFSSSNFYIGRRMHAKLVVADEQEALVGGINIADRYRGTPDEKPWLDYAVYLRGQICQSLENWGQGLSRTFDALKIPRLLRPHAEYPDPEQLHARISINDFVRNRKEITRSYNNALRKATKRVTIVGGYFLPGRKFRRLLRQAVLRGVDVQVIVTHTSDVPVTRLASEFLYGQLLKSRVRIFEYKDAMVHGKAAVADGIWMTIGSYNQNPLSAYLSIELNMDLVNRELASGFQEHLDAVIANHCEEVTVERYHLQGSWLMKMKRWVAYRLVKWSLRLLFLASRVETEDD